jgi:hypothetical protein
VEFYLLSNVVKAWQDGSVDRLRTLALLLLAGCLPGPLAREQASRIFALQDDDRSRRDAAFQELLRASAPIPALRGALGVGGQFGFPVVALLYAQGRGDAVPLDLRALHLAGFEWPTATSSENGVVEPFVKLAVELDLARTGRPALRPLSKALEGYAGDEAGAMRIVRAMIRIGGREAAREFARLLGVRRDLGGPRVCDAAASALLYLGRQELALRIAEPDARVAAARSWWELAKDFPESEWIRDAVEALATKGKDSVFDLLVGQSVEDPRDWWERNRDWRPAAAPLRPEELLPALGSDRARAYDANRRLEEAAGTKVFLPRMDRVSELAAALRLWRAPGDLALRWHRWLESPLLRLSVAAIGASAKIRWATEVFFHPTEEESGELRIETETESYALYVQALDSGTRLVVSEAHGAGGLWKGELREFAEGRPMVMFSTPFKSALVAAVEEVQERRVTPSALELQLEWRARLRGWAESGDALRALGYFQDAADRELLREHRAGAALLLLGDPAALELRPRLEPHEIEMALRKAEDPRVRQYLEELRTGRPR